MPSDRTADPASSIQAMGGLTDEMRVEVGPPSGEGWVRVDRLHDPRELAAATERMAGHTDGLPAVEATYLVGWVVCAVLWPAIAGPVVLGRQVPIHPDAAWVGWHPEGWIDALAVAPPGVGEAVSRPDPVVVADAARVLVGPLIESFADRRALGRQPLWGAVADGVSWMALGAAQLAGWDDDDATALAAELVRALPRSPGTPAFLTAHRGPRSRLLRIKQACCLAYTIPSHEGRYCLTCPFQCDVVRDSRLSNLFDQEK